MYESKTFKAALTLVLIVIVLEGHTKRPNLRMEKKTQPRDYRPSKWIPNSAMDIWYGNKSMIDIVSREWSDILNKIILRSVRNTPEKPEGVHPRNDNNFKVTNTRKRILSYNSKDIVDNVIVINERSKVDDHKNNAGISVDT
ncbi:hypothetical protein evm_001504 [Chilo suppressalis]|nr:hypothetical protein evm_001504 [Chilo suppressalis]